MQNQTGKQEGTLIPENVQSHPSRLRMSASPSLPSGPLQSSQGQVYGGFAQVDQPVPPQASIYQGPLSGHAANIYHGLGNLQNQQHMQALGVSTPFNLSMAPQPGGQSGIPSNPFAATGNFHPNNPYASQPRCPPPASQSEWNLQRR